MIQSNTRQSTKSISIRLLVGLVAAVAAVALPQLCHLLGAAVGAGSTVGEMLLPMHLPVLLCGLVAGPLAGVVAGAAAPLISIALTGMPAAVMLPVMVAELTVYGLVAGLLKNRRLPIVLCVLIAQLAGRLIRAGIVALIVGLGVSPLGLAAAYTNIVIGLPGIVLQLALLPLLMNGLKKVLK